ncbi:MAG: DNA mismatch repair endonuclease MutL [Phycisphaerales bacterium]|nr:MAG: DNA mismatch repair endonuclease MutL [Phycisphaerales bacterium]
MGRIRALSDELIKKIAAGEVIERPASVVKELMENAIDARASRIAVDIEDGGKRLVRVVDDGEGMSAEDLRLAVMPHATSKISRDEDLFAIGTMGFRGEALASVGAVSRLRIRSRPPDAAEGHEIVVVAEKVELSRSAGCPVGTGVEVRDLFFSVPARRKFLKGASTEAAHVNEQFTRIALAHPDVAFELAHNSRVTHRMPVQGSVRERVAKFCGRELADDLIPIDWDERGLWIQGYVAPPARSRSAGNWQYVFLNGRFVRDRFVQHAVKEAYRGLIEPNRHPVVFLFLSVDPAAVDVNVHPTKIEVRWRDSNLVHSQVLAALREKFLKSDLTPSLQMRRAGEPSGGLDAARADRLRREAADFLRGATPTTGAEGSEVRGLGRSLPPSPGGGERLSDYSASGELWRSLHGPAPQGSDLRGDEPAPPAGGRPRAIQLHNAYLVAETTDGMIIIDQHALHERIMYDKLRRRIAGDVLESQRLLLPETIRITPEQMAVLDTCADLLHRLGLALTPFGRDSVAVNAIPSVLRDTDVSQFVRDVLDRLAVKGHQPDTEAVLEDMLRLMACKAAVKFGDPLTPDEIEALLSQRGEVEKSTSCPHGRPTALRFTLADLERQFKRT